MAITPDEYFDFLDTFVDYVVEQRIPLSENNLREYIQYLTRRTHDYRCMRSNCGAGRSFFLVDSGGDVYPCAHSAGLPSWKLGKIGEEGDLAGMGARHPIMQQFPLRLVDLMDDARSCPWRHFCEGGCAVNAYQQFKTIQATDTLCAFYERIYPRLLERLATDPAAFQTLLDITFGPNQASVVEFSLDGRPASPSPLHRSVPVTAHPR